MIDAIDECEKPYELLVYLAKLKLELGEMDESKPLHIMLCGRDHYPVRDYFDGCLQIASRSVVSEDQAFYIDTEIDFITKIKPWSLFCSSSKNYPARLKDLLKRKGGGLFRWVEIQIVNFRDRDFRTSNDIERHLERLERDTSDKELDDEYRTLFGLLKDSELDLDRAIRMLKFIACAIDSLTG
jgi:hypothetical protein